MHSSKSAATSHKNTVAPVIAFCEASIATRMLRNAVPAFPSGELRDRRFRNVTCRSLSRLATHTETPRRPGRPRRHSTHDAITRAALDLLAERGFQAATIEAIAQRAGVGRNTIYRRWRSKEELIADALRELTTDFDLWRADDLYSLLLNWLRDFSRTFSDPLLGRLLAGVLGELQRNPVFADVYAERVVRPRRDALRRRLREAQGQGELRADVDVEQVADLLGGPCYFGSYRWGSARSTSATRKSCSRRSGGESRPSSPTRGGWPSPPRTRPRAPRRGHRRG